MRRSLLGISQEHLADAVNVTFQQIQKYERGTNRVSAGRLYQFSKALDVPIAYFYQDFGDTTPKASYGLSDSNQDDFVSEDTLYSKETLELLRTYYTLSDEKKRRELMKIIRSMVENMAD
jgi:transcriptional regulator with XRE-family HTH domain